MKLTISTICITIILLSGCGNTKTEQKSETQRAEEKQAQTTINEVAQNLKQSTNKAIDKAAIIAQDITERSSEVVSKVAKETKKISDTATEKMIVIKKEIDSKLEKVNLDLNTRGKELYAKCAGCHGIDAKKKALNKSAVIRDWNKEKIVSSLKGYKEGTYGANMKALMTNQVKNLSEDDFDALASYILSLE